MRGERTTAKDIKIGYFAQHQLEQLDLHASPLLHLQRLDANATEKELRSFLGGFGFQGDMALSAITNFSGGEKARLALALIVYQRPNLLLLDEPTNHLDLEMRHALSVALQDFTGAMIIVSHDRHLLRTVTDTLWLVANGKVETFDGDVDDYQRWVIESESKTTVGSENLPATTATNKKQLRQNAAEIRRQLQPLRSLVKKLEQQLSQLSETSAELNAQLADNSLYQANNKARLTEVLAQKRQLDQQQQTIEQQWLDASEKLEIALKESEGQ